jgi:AraC family transcriptional regulator, exoenzyme S synthesis regulatory protein ExsA
VFTRFPEAAPGFNKAQTVAFGNIPYALLSVSEVAGKKHVFLTDNLLMFIMKGKKIIHFPEQEVALNEDTIVILKRGLYIFSEYIPEGGSFEALTIFIPDHFCKKLLHDIPVQAPPLPSPPYYLIASDELLTNFKAHYKSYFGKSLNNLQYILDIKLQELFLLLTSTSAKNELLGFIHTIQSAAPIAIDFVVSKYLLQPLSVAELAKLSGRSLAAFKRDFKQLYQASPRQWINEQRLKQARVLLVNSSKTINEITFSCGYENTSHFIRLFKKTYGITPASIRKKELAV